MMPASHFLLCLSAAAASGAAPAPANAEVPASPEEPAVSRSGVPYSSGGPPELVNAIRTRRKGGKLLNLDRMLLQRPPFADAWNTSRTRRSWS